MAIGPTPWRFLKKKYGVSGLRIKRFSIKRDMMSTKIEITLKPVRVVFVNPLDVS